MQAAEEFGNVFDLLYRSMNGLVSQLAGTMPSIWECLWSLLWGSGRVTDSEFLAFRGTPFKPDTG